VARGTLITIEGIDGAGKTTLAGALHDALGVEVIREPGGVELSERVRALVKDPALHVSPRAEALLYAAARAQLVAELLGPRLEAGEALLLDRFSDSTLAYQGAGRGLGVEEMRRLDAFATGGLTPDRTLLLTLAPEVALARLDAQRDRLESAPLEFFAAVAAAYDALAAAEPERFRMLDATRSPDEVLEAALATVANLFAD
jgi:dTMP kinase